VKKNVSLKALHTFGLSVSAAAYASVSNEEELLDLLPVQKPTLILGGGSNVLFTKDFKGLVLHNSIKGIEVLEETEQDVLVRVGGGEVWHDLVLWCIDQGYGGIENLSLIPGSVGAAPIQNIGAYGVEVKDVFERLEAIDIKTGEIKTFEHKDCHFGYRDSVFKRALKGKYCITRVIFRLSKRPIFNVSYGAIQAVLEEEKALVSIHSISDAVIQIRQQKLPDPKKIGNSGSFFKNPIIPIEQFNKLKIEYPEIPFYPFGKTEVKLPAGWLIDQLGWKGYRKGDAGVHKNQALVLVNYGNAKGSEIWGLAQEIQQSVSAKYGIHLEAEVNIL
jgi:UDP-N-acetylmuramate dehydrogenase